MVQLTHFHRLGESMNSSFDKWDPILLKVSEIHPAFQMYLSEDLVHNLIFDAARESPKNASAEGLFLWLTHILTSSAWESQQPYVPRSYILSACEESSSHWAKMLGDRLNEHGGVRSSSRRASNGSSGKKARKSTDQDVSSILVDERLRAHGWAPVEKWDSRALGVAASS